MFWVVSTVEHVSVNRLILSEHLSKAPLVTKYRIMRHWPSIAGLELWAGKLAQKVLFYMVC